MFIAPKNDTHTVRTVHVLKLMSAGCGGGAALCRLSGNPAGQGLHVIFKGWGAAAFALRWRVVRQKVCAQQARVVVSKVEEPEVREEGGGATAQRKEDQIRGASGIRDRQHDYIGMIW